MTISASEAATKASRKGFSSHEPSSLRTIWQPGAEDRTAGGFDFFDYAALRVVVFWCTVIIAEQNVYRLRRTYHGVGFGDSAEECRCFSAARYRLPPLLLKARRVFVSYAPSVSNYTGSRRRTY